MKIPSLKDIWFNYFEPSAEPLCKESREMLKECIANSVCYKKLGDFKRCVQEDIDPDCIAARVQYSKCKRATVDRNRDFRTEQRNK